MSRLLLSLFSVLVFAAAASAAGHKPFECIKVRDLDVRTVAMPVFGYVSKKACAHECVAMDTRCSAFHYSNSRCHLLPPVASWKEQQQKSDVEICIKANGENPKCTAQRFPYAHGRSRYAYIRQKMNWRSAAIRCVRMNGKLAQLTTTGEMKAISALLKKNRASAWTFNGQIQLPGYKGNKDGWVWHRSGDPILPEFWHRGEPNNFGGKQTVGGFYRNGQLDDQNSWVLFNSVCECLII